MTRRIWGIETEYGITCAASDPAASPLDAEHAARELFRLLVERERTTNVFLPNGGRLYLDVGAHPEYATAECDMLADLLAHDAAGQHMLADLATQANERLAREGVSGVIHLLKNNVDSAGNSCGCHENYLLRRDSRFRDMADALVSFFVARQPLVGAGWVRPDGSYALSQRADHMDDAVSAATTTTRPIINTRDEPLAHARDFRRLHVIVGDSNVAEGSTLLKVGMTHLLLNALEAGADITGLTFADPLATLRASSADLDGTGRYELRDGRRLSIVEYLGEIAERVSAYPATSDPLESAVWDLWRRGMTALASGDWSGIDTELDFAIKHRLLAQVRERAGADVAPAMLIRMELAYHDITSAGLGEALAAAGRLRRFTSPEQRRRALTPPAAPRPPRTCAAA
ncbi:proteasome accessory factor PafA2 family protein [Nanchangia anserum]|uniref:proteasome accessory factor PafA2 family protein n=1 Tax=Nanchangia anserum TaxID=2692125 RepID=UPI0030B851A7